LRVIVQVNHLEYWMNGGKIVEYELGSDWLNTLIASSRFKVWPRFAPEKTGCIALQNDGNRV
jgi:hypothetical protein